MLLSVVRSIKIRSIKFMQQANRTYPANTYPRNLLREKTFEEKESIEYSLKLISYPINNASINAEKRMHTKVLHFSMMRKKNLQKNVYIVEYLNSSEWGLKM